MTSVTGIPVSTAVPAVSLTPLTVVDDDPSQWILAVDGTIGSDPVRFDLHMPEPVSIAAYKVLGVFGDGMQQKAALTLRSGDEFRIPLIGSYFVEGAKKFALREVARAKDRLIDGALSAVAARRWARPASALLAEGLFKSGHKEEASNLFAKLAEKATDARKKFELRLKAAMAAERYAKGLDETSRYEKIARAQWAAGQLYERVEEDAKAISEAIVAAYITGCEPNKSFGEHATSLQFDAAMAYERGGLGYEAQEALSHLFRKAAKAGNGKMALHYMSSAITVGVNWANGATNARTKRVREVKVIVNHHILGLHLMSEKKWAEAAAEFEKVCGSFAQDRMGKDNSFVIHNILDQAECLFMSGKPEEASHKLEPVMEALELATSYDNIVTTDGPDFWNILYHYRAAMVLAKMDCHLRAAESLARMDDFYRMAEKPLGRAMAGALQAEEYRKGGGTSMAKEAAIASIFAGDLYFGEAARQEKIGKKENDEIFMSQARGNFDEAAKQYVLAEGDFRTAGDHKSELAKTIVKAGDASRRLSRFDEAAHYYKEAANFNAASRDKNASAAAQKKLLAVLSAWFAHLMRTGEKRAAYAVGLRLLSEAGQERKGVHRQLIRLAAEIDRHEIPA